jgi:ribokinase
MIIVFGSINMDISIAVGKLPQPGETVLSSSYEQFPGGKGANQALAAHRMGPKTAIVGSAGDDAMGTRIVTRLRRHGVTTSGVAHLEHLPTGCAFIARDANGENQIIVSAGANVSSSANQVPDEILKPGVWLLMQMELRAAENWELLARARERGVTTMLNLSPALPVPEEALQMLDYLVVNELEAKQALQNLNLPSEEALAKKFDLTCVVTLGAKGAKAVLPDGRSVSVRALKLDKIVDTTGSGDAFCGTLAGALYENMPLERAMKYASAAASLSCLKEGAQTSYVYRGDVEDRLSELA